MHPEPEHATEPQPRRAWRVGAAVVLGALGLLLLLAPAWVGRTVGAQALNAHGLQLVDASIERTLVAFGTVSAVKATLAIVEGSAVGVGFHLEIGDLVQPAYDYVDFVWDIFLWANLVLMAYKILLETGILVIGFQIAGVGCGILALGLLPARRAPGVRRWGRRLLAYGLLFTVVVPLSLMASDALGRRYTEPLKEQQHRRMEEVERELDEARRRFTDLRTQISLFKPGDSLTSLKASMSRVAETMGGMARTGAVSFMYYVAIVLFELLVLPFATALMLWLAVKFILGRFAATGDPPTRNASGKTGPAPGGAEPDAADRDDPGRLPAP